MAVPDSYFAFVREHCGSPDGGTAGSYRTALTKLTDVFTANKPSWAPVADVWAMTDAAAIMSLYAKVKEEQCKFRKGCGIFHPYAGAGDSYYKKGWCSAALKYYAQFRAAEGYEPKFAAALASSDDGLEVAARAKKINFGNMAGYLPDDVDMTTREGKEIVKETKQRIGQDQFRKWILGIYGGKCCVTGLDIPEILHASHIVAWADDAKNRMNPSNGLCLSATYDAAFDRHLISFDDDYRMVLSKDLRDHCTKTVHQEYFLAFAGRQLSLPNRFAPDVLLLAKHRERLVG